MLVQVSLVTVQGSTGLLIFCSGLVCFSLSSLNGSWGISWAEPQREFPQCFLCQVITEVIKEGYDVIIWLQRVRNLLVALQSVQDVELLPTFREVDL